MTIYSDFESFFKNTQPGTTTDWLGGKLSLGSQGNQATWQPPTGDPMSFTQNTPLSQLYQNPIIQQKWDQKYPNQVQQFQPSVTANPGMPPNSGSGETIGGSGGIPSGLGGGNDVSATADSGDDGKNFFKRFYGYSHELGYAPKYGYLAPSDYVPPPPPEGWRPKGIQSTSGFAANHDPYEGLNKAWKNEVGYGSDWESGGSSMSGGGSTQPYGPNNPPPTGRLRPDQMDNPPTGGLQPSPVTPTQNGGGSSMSGGGGGFNIPTDLYPSSGSTNMGGSTSGSQTGINWDTDVAQGLINQLISGGQNLPGMAAEMGNTLQNQYANLMDRAMGPQAFQGTLNDLAGRNMMDSSVAGDAMAQTAQGIAKMVSDKAYESQLNQQRQQMEVPSMLADLIGLAQESESGSSSFNYGSSSNENPLAPYELMAQLMMY